eukprot:gnl/MRDRNA2_/MRDRNA2_80657_c0_seq1.p1 gnl/MRDRNA2_/MRDRNA2_80657_c0~~gnl/MRDRNA2_/MRDRNA2_80657_c0_seq1.p1  ORF type:complete len:166 (-),score=64.28 gnl/MRDRNA2_/MRDRNA2_80657_c0_seq1:267-764(-)
MVKKKFGGSKVDTAELGFRTNLREEVNKNGRTLEKAGQLPPAPVDYKQHFKDKAKQRKGLALAKNKWEIEGDEEDDEDEEGDAPQEVEDEAINEDEGQPVLKQRTEAASHEKAETGNDKKEAKKETKKKRGKKSTEQSQQPSYMMTVAVVIGVLAWVAIWNMFRQ